MADLPCILIVEDNPLFGQALVSHLARLDAFAVVAADVPEAIGLLEQVEFDLVIADCRLPHVHHKRFLVEELPLPRRASTRRRSALRASMQTYATPGG